MRVSHKLLIMSAAAGVVSPVFLSFTSCSLVKKPTILGKIPATAYAGNGAGHDANFQCVMQ
jgi:hypothetical protein